MSEPVDKKKVDAKTRLFMEFFEKELNVTFVDVSNDGEIEDSETPEDK